MDRDERSRLTAKEQIKQVVEQYEYKQYPTLWDTEVIREATQLLEELYDVGRKRYDIAPIAWLRAAGNLPAACLFLVHAKKNKTPNGLTW